MKAGSQQRRGQVFLYRRDRDRTRGSLFRVDSKEGSAQEPLTRSAEQSRARKGGSM